MHTAERCLFAVYDLAVAALVHFAAAVSTNVEAGFNGDADQISETLEQANAEFFAFFRQLKHLSLLLAHWLVRMFHQAFLFKLLQERVNKAWTDFFSEALPETAEYAVTVSWAFVEHHEYVESREI
jgi:hypothetical protein